MVRIVDGECEGWTLVATFLVRQVIKLVTFGLFLNRMSRRDHGRLLSGTIVGGVREWS
jgi:hypothetical protein